MGGGARQIHFAEEWNELHHLQIMESLGGDQYWVDRFLAQHAAVFYYWTVVLFFAVSPSNAYTFSELVEARSCAACLGPCLCVWHMRIKVCDSLQAML